MEPGSSNEIDSECPKVIPRNDFASFCNTCSRFHRIVYSRPLAGVHSTPPPPRAAEPTRRRRTKFSDELKARMSEFAERIGWRIRRTCGGKGNDEVSKFCREVGVKRGSFKVWMYRNRNKASSSAAGSTVATATTAREDGGDDVTLRMAPQRRRRSMLDSTSP